MEKKECSAIKSRDIKIVYLYRKYMDLHSKEDVKELRNEIENRIRIEERFANLRFALGVEFSDSFEVKKFDCYKTVGDKYKKKCGIDEYDLKFFHNFVTLCNSGIEMSKHLELVNNMC